MSEISSVEDWVRAALAGEEHTPVVGEGGLDPALVAALAPLFESHRAQRDRLADLDAYLTELSLLFLEFSAGNFDVQVRMRGEDHTDAVGLGLNMMVEELQAVTEQLSVARDAALAANAAKSTFLANMSHELRTPLNAIIGYGELIQDDLDVTPGAEDMAEDVDKILRAARHLLRLISEVLDLSKVEAGKMELAIEAVEVRTLVDSVVDTVKPGIEAGGNQLVIELDAAPTQAISTDGMKLQQTLLNLLGNASKFTENGTIGLRVRTEGDSIVFEVQDTGLGIAPDRLQAIFDPFTQERADTARLHGGTGLGLAICSRFAGLMGGRLEVTSTVGTGSLFTLTLPLVRAERTEDPDPVPIWRSRGSTILVVDDDPVAHELMRRHVAPLGCTVVGALSGAQGLELARELMPALITLDVFMPEMDGWTTLARLKTDPLLCDIPVAMITIQDDAQRAQALGADEYLTKPVERRRLLEVVARYGGDARRRVLVVDDDPDAREVASRMLTGAGFVVSQAIDGLEAMHAIAGDPPDLILLDLMMPRMDGFEVVHALHADPDFNIPIVVLTAKQIDQRDRERLELGARSILSKGRDLKLVLSRMTDLLTH